MRASLLTVPKICVCSNSSSSLQQHKVVLTRRHYSSMHTSFVLVVAYREGGKYSGRVPETVGGKMQSSKLGYFSWKWVIKTD